jgi:hypothetical protein
MSMSGIIKIPKFPKFFSVSHIISSPSYFPARVAKTPKCSADPNFDFNCSTPLVADK